MPTMKPSKTASSESKDESEQVFASAAELFAILSTPIRLRLISALCNGEKNVSQLLGEIEATQPNMSQHLATLYRAGILGKRREGTQIFYRLQSQRAATLCRAVCTQIATEIDGDNQIPLSERLLPTLRQG
jgi:DNA-binding transcriptional ArsR family regulator